MKLPELPKPFDSRKLWAAYGAMGAIVALNIAGQADPLSVTTLGLLGGATAVAQGVLDYRGQGK